MTEAPDIQVPDERLDSYTVKEMAAASRIPESTILRAIHAHDLKAFFMGTRAGWRISVPDFIAWRESHSNQAKIADDSRAV